MHVLTGGFEMVMVLDLDAWAMLQVVLYKGVQCLTMCCWMDEGMHLLLVLHELDFLQGCLTDLGTYVLTLGLGERPIPEKFVLYGISTLVLDLDGLAINTVTSLSDLLRSRALYLRPVAHGVSLRRLLGLAVSGVVIGSGILTKIFVRTSAIVVSKVSRILSKPDLRFDIVFAHYNACSFCRLQTWSNEC